MSVVIGLFGAVGVAYVFGLVTVIINQANEESNIYRWQLEELKAKMSANRVPHNLKIKIMEYFHYSWRKNNVLKKMNDFSELSAPLQRDIALYQHQEMLLKVPLFKELDPVEILSIIQKLKYIYNRCCSNVNRTSIYMPGDKVVREGERGTEMYFIQEGVVEMLVKKLVLDENSNKIANVKYEKLFLEKGAYFGEVFCSKSCKYLKLIGCTDVEF